VRHEYNANRIRLACQVSCPAYRKNMKNGEQENKKVCNVKNCIGKEMKLK
jgi:hypothetical protein